MHKLVISLDSYYWIRFVSGTIIHDPSEFELVIVYKDTRNIFWMKNLCGDAIHEQRKYDLFQIGTELGIKKAINLLYEYDNMRRYKRGTVTTLGSGSVRASLCSIVHAPSRWIRQ